MKRTHPCRIDDCEKLVYRSELCPMHYNRWRRHGDPLGKGPMARGNGPDHPRWKGDEAGYAAIHLRLTAQRGKVSDYLCDQCGVPARDWAYTNDDPDGKLDPRSGCYYSTDPERYVPMCVPCHKRFDLAHAREAV